MMGRSQKNQRLCALANKADGQPDCPGDAFLPVAQLLLSYRDDFKCLNYCLISSLVLQPGKIAQNEQSKIVAQLVSLLNNFLWQLLPC